VGKGLSSHDDKMVVFRANEACRGVMLESHWAKSRSFVA